MCTACERTLDARLFGWKYPAVARASRLLRIVDMADRRYNDAYLAYHTPGERAQRRYRRLRRWTRVLASELGHELHMELREVYDALHASELDSLRRRCVAVSQEPAR